LASAPAAASSQQIVALDAENKVRAAMGVVCASEDPYLAASATRHCAYYAANTAKASCIADPHTEVAGCADFVAANFWTRESDAGYAGGGAFEDMAFNDNAQASLTQWIDSVWHRTPILSPWIVQMGYGQATGCDTMDFGFGGTVMSAQTVASYPYSGQAGVPLSYNGTYEGPTPPAPPAGWPSGYPITIFAKGTFSSHTLTVDGSSTAIAHQWVDSNNDNGLLENSAGVLYANTPLTANTTYHVVVAGTFASGSTAFTADFKFTTGAQ
jgi:hypothetical protein